MLSFVITVFALLLVTLVILVVLRFTSAGSDPHARARKEATFLLEQGQRILGAANQFHAKNSTWPDSAQQLVDGGFLAEIPQSKSASGKSIAWLIDSSGIPVFSLPGVATEAVCREVNAVARAVDGIALKAYTALAAQCFGANEQALTVVVAAAGADLELALPPGQAAVGEPPARPQDAGWLRAPTHALVPSQAPSSAGAVDGTRPQSLEGLNISYTNLQMEPSEVNTPTTPRVQPTLQNTTDSPMVIEPLELSEGLSIGLGNCAAGIPARSACQLELTYKSPKIGSHSATGVLRLNGQYQVSMRVSGTGTAPVAPESSAEAAGIRISYQSLEFGEVAERDMREAVPLVISNVSDRVIYLNAISVSDDVDYSLDYSSCLTQTVEAGALQSGESCQVAIGFMPHAQGQLVSMLTLQFEGGTHTLRLSGTGRLMAPSGLQAKADGVRLGAGPLSLGVQGENVAPGGKFRAKVLSLVNTGGQALRFDSVSITARQGVTGFLASAALPGDPAGCQQVSIIYPGEHCEVQVEYSASSTAGEASAELAARFIDQKGSPVLMSLVVTAKAHDGWLALVDAQSGFENGSTETPGGWNFETVALGNSVSKKYFLLNKGLVPIALRGLRISSPGEPVEGEQACVEALELEPGKKCVIILAFSPVELNPGNTPSRLSVQVQASVPTVGDNPQLATFVVPNMLAWSVKGWPISP